MDRNSDVGAGICGYLNLQKVDRFDDILGAPGFFDHWVSLE